MERKWRLDVCGNDERTSGGWVHFGMRRNVGTQMKPYIFGARNGIYIIDLQKTVQLFKEAYHLYGYCGQRGIYPLRRDKKAGPGTINEQAAVVVCSM